MSEVNWLTIEEAAKRYGLSRDGLRAVSKRHKVPCMRVTQGWHVRRLLIDGDAIDAAMKRERIDPAAIGEEWFTTKQVKQMLGIGGTTLDAMIRGKQINRVKILEHGTNQRLNLFHRDEVARAKSHVDARAQTLRRGDAWRENPPPLVELVQITPLDIPGESDATRKARQSAEYDAAIEQELPIEVIYRRGLAIRLLHTPYLVDASRNPHCLGRSADRDEIEAMVLRLEAGEIAITARDLPVTRLLGREPVGMRVYNDRQNGKNRVLNFAGSC